MAHFKPPFYRLDSNKKYTSIFLAGTIDMGESENWQEKIAEEFENQESLIDNTKVDIYNPRRDDWDSSWKQDLDNPKFFEQVTWELDQIDKSNIVIFNFLPTSKSPITLLELGYCSRRYNNIYVCCPKEFHRSGNVHILCLRQRIPLYESMEELINEIKIKYQITHEKISA